MPNHRSLALVCLALLLNACTPAVPTSVPSSAPALTAQGKLNIKNADPSVIRVGSTFYSVESQNGDKLYVRSASSLDGLASASAQLVFGNPGGWKDNWAPEIVKDGNTYYIYFASGAGDAHRMYWMSSSSPTGGYSSPQKLNLPDDRWAIDGMLFTFGGQRWFVWSGWAGTSNVEQNLYIVRMSSPTQPSGARFVISQPREWWEQVDSTSPTVNEAPQAIKDPSGQLHIVYSANGSWNTNYCLADLRLRSGGDPTYVWDWWKSNGCLFSSRQDIMMNGWDRTLYTKGVGHHSFALLNGDIGTSPPSGSSFPMLYHGVPMNESPTPFWFGRFWYSGSFMWWGNTTYSRGGSTAGSNSGWSLKFFE